MASLTPPGLNVHVEVADDTAQHYRDQGWTDFDPDLRFTEDPDDEDSAGDHTGDGPPPRSGRGSSRDSWVRYAASMGVPVTAETDRAAVIAACEAAGVPTGSGE